MLAMTLDNATICRHFFVGMAHSYGIFATNLMVVKQELGNQPNVNSGKRKAYCVLCGTGHHSAQYAEYRYCALRP